MPFFRSLAHAPSLPQVGHQFDGIRIGSHLRTNETIFILQHFPPRDGAVVNLFQLLSHRPHLFTSEFGKKLDKRNASHSSKAEPNTRVIMSPPRLISLPKRIAST